jgi:hypothetical protein
MLLNASATHGLPFLGSFGIFPCYDWWRRQSESEKEEEVCLLVFVVCFVVG